jgi:transposase
MEIVYERCASIDVHKDTAVTTVRLPAAKVEGKGQRRSETRTFSTKTPGLLELSDWLTACGVTHVAMESTGVYWRPIHNILEGSFEILLVNAHHVKAVPGRKTDVKDSEWLAELLEHGLLRGSFIPPEPIRDLRDLTRCRKKLVQDRTHHINRLMKTLEMANIKLSSVATDVLGKSGRRMIEALISGQQDGEVLADMALGVLKKKREDLKAALTGRIRPHHAFLLREHLLIIDQLEQRIAAFDKQIEECMAPFREAVARLVTIPGVAQRTAENIIAEIGTNMLQFPTPEQLCSWAAICPGNNESGGKRKTGRTRKGNAWLRTTLVEAAWAASRCKGSYLKTFYWRLKLRRGANKAIVAVAHSMLQSIWYMLSMNVDYKDLGPEHFDRLNHKRVRDHHIRRLQELGYQVTLGEVA